MKSPSIFLWCDPWFVQIVLNFFHTLIVVHRIHRSEKHGLPVPFETSASWDQSTSGYLNIFHLHFRRDRCTRWSPLATVHCLAMQDQRDCLLSVPELLWNTGSVWKWVQAILEPFLWSSSFCQESYPSITWPMRSTIKLCLDFFHKVIKPHCTIIFSRNWWIMSQQSDHAFLTLQNNLHGFFWIDVYPFSFTNRKRKRGQCHSRL